MPRKLELGPALAALGGVLLLASLFVDWFGGLSGWAVFEVLDLVLAAVAVAALLAAAAASGIGTVGDARWLPALGLVALLVVVVQLLEPPPGAVEDRETGAWLALVGAALLLLGALLRSTAISVSVQVRDAAPGAAARRRVPAVDRRTADGEEDGGPGPGPEAGAVAAPSRGSLFADDPAEDDTRTQPLAAEDRPPG